MTLFSSLIPQAYAAAVAAKPAEPTIKGIISKFENQVLSPIITLLFIIATILFMWGVIQYAVGSRGDESMLKKGKQVMLWGIIGMTVMASAWGIVRIICDYFGTGCRIGSGVYRPNVTPEDRVNQYQF